MLNIDECYVSLLDRQCCLVFNLAVLAQTITVTSARIAESFRLSSFVLLRLRR